MNLLNRSFVDVLGSTSPDAEVEIRLAKINGCLKSYATFRGSEVDLLTVLDVVGQEGMLHPDLSAHVIKHYPNVSTRGSQTSNLRYLSQVVCDREGKQQEGKIFAESNLPDYMKPLWFYLPRRNWKRKIVPTDQERARFPLSRLGESMLRALLIVDDEVEPGDVKALFITHSLDLIRAVKKSVHHRDRQTVLSLFNRVRSYLGLVLQEKTQQLSLDDLPPTLRAQIERFTVAAPMGLRAYPDIVRAATDCGVNVAKYKPMRSQTIEQYIRFLLRGLSRIELPGDVKIEDLVRLEDYEFQANDRTVNGFRNPLIEQFRCSEREKQTEFKEAGYDSVTFKNFISAIKSVAAYNQVLGSYNQFRQTYRVNLDRESKDRRKALKKRILSRKWLYNEIRRCKERFDQVVRSGSFKSQRKDLELCMFFPQLVVLAFTGYRQECIRNCNEGEHIKFGVEGDVAFTWAKYEIKNEKQIESTISRSEHGNIPELVMLLEVLNDYRRKVLGHLKRQYGAAYQERIGSAFFGYVDRDGCVRRFSHESAKLASNQLTAHFKKHGYAFLNFDDFFSFDVSFHPHFLRGVCCDWLKDDLGMTWEEISDTLGDTIQTLMRDYYGGRKRQSGTKAFARVSSSIGKGDDGGRISATVAEALTDQIKSLKEDKSVLQTKLGEAEAQITLLRGDIVFRDQRLAEQAVPCAA